MLERGVEQRARLLELGLVPDCDGTVLGPWVEMASLRKYPFAMSVLIPVDSQHEVFWRDSSPFPISSP